MSTKVEMRVGRNAPCPCGSGKKFKRCCATQEKFHEAARTGEFAPHGIPADVPLEVVRGTVIYNDGHRAEVRLPDDTAVFHRGPESDEQWDAQWGFGKQIVLERFAYSDLQEVQ